MDNKSLTIKTDSKNIDVTYVDNEVVVEIHNNMDLKIEFDNNVMIESKGDITFASQGELALISLGEKLCLDSVDSEIHLNYRESKHLINLPESISYRKKQDEIALQNVQIATMQEMENKTLKQRVSDLEDHIRSIERYLNRG